MKLYLPALLLLLALASNAQPVTGVWKGKIHNRNVELKLVKTGDSLVGNAYYYTSRSNFTRYSIKGYFDPETNNVIWWDDVLLSNKVAHSMLHQSSDPLLNVADFNCPGEDEMRLDGNSSGRDDKNDDQGAISLQKVKQGTFKDDWDWVIENYTVGGNDPKTINDINLAITKPYRELETDDVALQPSTPAHSTPRTAGKTVTPGATATKPSLSIATPQTPAPDISNQHTASAPIAENTPEMKPAPRVPDNQSRFAERKKVLQQVIPFDGRAFELKFYDNAEIDGDSIAVYLNGQLLAEHIRLTDHAFVIKVAQEQLQDDNELVMVAENLGSIPPNTSLMTVMIGDKEYEAHLYSTEKSSALIRFVRKVEVKEGANR